MSLKNIIIIFLLMGVSLLIGCVENQGDNNRVVETVAGIETLPTGDLMASRNAGSVGVSDAQKGIVVTGTGRKSVTPDIAIFTVGVTTQGKTSGEALSENARLMNNVVDSLKKGEIAATDIQTQSVSVWPQFDYGRELGKEPPTILGYRAENRVGVRVHDIEDLGDLIDSSINAGGNQLYGVSFTLSEESSRRLREDVLTLAVEDAHNKAEVLASAIGAGDVKVVGVLEGGGSGPPIYRLDVAALEAKDASTPISPGESEVSASITITYEILE